MSIFASLTSLRGAALTLTAVSLSQAVPAAAVTHIVNATGNPANTTTATFTFNGSLFNTGNLILDPIDPFTVEEGDIIELTLTLASGFIVPGSGEQLFGLNFFRADGENPIITASMFETTVSGSGVFSYSLGPTGLPNDTQGGSCSNCLTSIMGQVPGDSFTFDRLVLRQTIDRLGGPYTVDTASFSYQLRDLAAVPEPATWAMMILGFGVVGGAMRRRVRVRAAIAV
jgi:hypothetical protein